MRGASNDGGSGGGGMGGRGAAGGNVADGPPRLVQPGRWKAADSATSAGPRGRRSLPLGSERLSCPPRVQLGARTMGSQRKEARVALRHHQDGRFQHAAKPQFELGART